MKTLYLSIALLLFALPVEAKFTAEQNAYIEIIVRLGITNQNATQWNTSERIGEKICKASGALGCHGATIGEGICRASGNIGCYGVSIGEALCKTNNSLGCMGSTVGEGICKAGGATMCFGVSVAEGICRGTGGIGCYDVTLGEAICRSRGHSLCQGVSVTEAYSKPIRDTSWDWDQFYDDHHHLIWRCRGIQSGQFAVDSKCKYKTRIDHRWPRKSAPY